MSALTGPAGSSLTADYSPDKKPEQTPTEPSTKKDDKVLAIQQALLAQGFTLEEDAPNGILGPKTQQAIASFQTQNGLKPTGQPDDQTLSLLTRKPDARVMFGGPNA